MRLELQFGRCLTECVSFQTRLFELSASGLSLGRNCSLRIRAKIYLLENLDQEFKNWF